MKVILRSMVAVAMVMGLCGWGVAAELPSKVTLANGEWAPYQSKNLKHSGVASRIVTEAFQEGGVEVTFAYKPWKRGFEEAKAGKLSGTFLWFDKAERRKDFLFSDPVVDITYVFFYRKDKPFAWNTVEDLKGLKIAATKEYTYGEAFEKAEKAKTIKVERTSKDIQGFKKLLAGKVDVFPCEVDTGLELIKKEFSVEDVAKLAWHPLPVKKAPHHLLISKKTAGAEALLKVFNKGLADLKADGRLARYLKESREGAYKK
ncbi:MAG: substrate-binding periplasmic protein [Planctomycetota bacterium]|jgi:polar amino acid transport system substrate-binding protein